MELSAAETLFLMASLAVFSTFIQSLEFILLRRDYWPWELVRRDYLFLPKPIIAILDFFLAEKAFFHLNIARSVAVFFFPPVLPPVLLTGFLFFTTILACLRYRGSFNGGSDFMTLITLLATTIALSFPHPGVIFACLWYAAIQSCSSYFIGGFVKLRRRQWRNGSALAGFIGSTIYKEGWLTSYLRSHRSMAALLSWLAICFEIGFPFLVMFQPLTSVVLVAGISFHLANAYLFGLNRFTFAWMATYPALLFCSQSLTRSFG